MKRRNQKVIFRYSTDELQVLSSWTHRIRSLSNSPRTANQEKILLKGVSEGDQDSFTNICREAAALVKNTGHLMKGSPLQRWFSSPCNTVPNQISVKKLLSQHKRKCKHKKHNISSRCCMEHRAPAFLICERVQVCSSWHNLFSRSKDLL